MLIVGRNLDRIGQNPYLLTYLPYSDSILFFIMSYLWLFYSNYSYLCYSRNTERISHLGILYLRLLKEIGDLRQKNIIFFYRYLSV
jgi:hypothetical protein